MSSETLNACEEWVTFAIAAKRLHRSKKTLYDWSSRGLLDGVRLGRGRKSLLCWPGLLEVVAEIGRPAGSSQTPKA